VKFLLKVLEYFNKDTGGIMAIFCKTDALAMEENEDDIDDSWDFKRR
jgi:hypothetical protein